MHVRGCHRPPPMFKEKSFQFDIDFFFLLHFQTICLLWSRCLQCCPQRNDFSPTDVSRQQSLDLRSWPSYVVSYIYGRVVFCFFFSPVFRSDTC